MLGIRLECDGNPAGRSSMDSVIWMAVEPKVRGSGDEPVQFLCSNKCIETELV